MAFAAIGSFRSFSRPRATATAGTVITSFIPPMNRLRTKISKIVYLSGSTQHTITAMRTMAKTTVAVAASGAATSLVLTRDPGNYSASAVADQRAVPSVANNLVAANDYLAVAKPDGTWLVFQPSGVATDATGRLTLTVTALPTGGIAADAEVHFFGAIGDTDPNTGEAHPTLAPTVSTTTSFDANGGGSLVESTMMDHAILLHSGNATAAGSIEYVCGIYGP